ncbi:MAG: amino acid adenylation domain-containing protein [Myxococcota bacterium]
MTSIDERLAGLSPEKRRLLQKRLAERRRAEAPRAIECTGEATAPLSFAQRRLWFLEQLEPGSPVYNNASAIDGSGAIVPERLERAFDAVVRRHESLRTRFVPAPDGEEAIAQVAPFGSSPGGRVALEVMDLRSLAAPERDARLQMLLARVAEEPFDLAQGPPMRALLALQPDDRWTLAVTFHHLVSDAWSTQRFLGELVAEYRAAASGGEANLPELPIQYGDFARWQRSDACGAELERQQSWWIERLHGVPAALSLPLDRPRRATPTHAGDSLRFALDQETTEGLRRLAAEHEGTTLFMVLLAGFSALLARLTGDTDLALGTAVGGRSRAETERLIGLFVNTLVLRVDVSDRPSFRELLARARETAVGAFAHPDVPFEQLVEALPVPREASVHPLFQVLFMLQNVPKTGSLGAADVEIAPRATTNRRARFDLTMAWVETADGLIGNLEYATDLFDRATIERWSDAYATLLAGAVATPDAPIDALPLGLAPSVRSVSAQEPPSEPSSETVAQRFSRRAAHRGAHPAVGGAGGWWSYAELERRSDALARHLAARGVRPETRVGVAAERDVPEWLAVLAIWKAGGAYVPLDPSFPEERLAWIVASSDVEVVLTSGDAVSLRLPDHVETIAIGEFDAGSVTAPKLDVALPDADADRLAYVLYTSGSTGRPKGVGVSHRSALFFLEAMAERLGWTEDVRMLSVTTLGFDISLLERWGPLLVGGSSQLVAAADAEDGTALARVLAESDANVLQGTPATWRLLREAGWQPERRSPQLTALVGGDALPVELARWMASRAAAVWNLYGPTETTVWSTAHAFDPAAEADGSRTVFLGEALGATRLAVIDAQLRPVPVGVWGELAIGGPGVARGYEGRGAETASRFVPDPFDAAPGARLYRTGDVCRFRADGGLEFAGRKDGQVKLRGYRIETGEIEARLCETPAVEASAVVVAGETLVAFVVSSGGALDVQALATELARSLPTYMVPRRIERREALPLTPNRKVDRRRLAEEALADRALRVEYVAPRTPTEAAIAEIFADVLGLEKVGARADFFDLGGHSLLATRVVSRVRERLQRELPLRDLFEAPSVEALAARVDQLGAEGAGAALVAVPDGARPERIPTSHAQERLWFLDQLRPGDAAYAIPLVLRLRGALDTDALAAALSEVVRRHEVLRTTFPSRDGLPEQQIHGPDSELAIQAARVEHLDLSQGDGETRDPETRDAAMRDHAFSLARQPFDLGGGPLLRASLIRLDDCEHLAVLVMHHIVSDGWSVGVLARELTALYQAQLSGTPSPLPPLEVQYADWALYERALLAGGALQRGAQHWAQALRDVPAHLELPTRSVGSEPTGPFAARQHLQLDAKRVAAVQTLARDHDATLFMVLLAAYGAALYAEGAGADLVIGCPSAGREDPRVEASIGFFVNTLPLRLGLHDQQTLRELIGVARDVTQDALAHRRVPFAKIAESAAVEGRVPESLGQLWFVLQNVPPPALQLGDLEVEPLAGEEIAAFANGRLPSRYDLKLELLEEPGGAIRGGFEYRVDRFEATVVERLTERFVALVAALADAPDQTLGEWRASAQDRSAGQLANQRRSGLAALRPRRSARA